MGRAALIDLHNHTTISSGCTVLTPDALVEAARDSGLAGVFAADHLSIEGPNVTQSLGRERGFPEFRGVEARTDLGDVLVYGYYRDTPERIALGELCRHVHGAGGLVFAAHPFHTTGGPSPSLGFRLLGRDPDADWHRLDVLTDLDGVETLNGQVLAFENARAYARARHLQMPGIGGSDAHATAAAGAAATRFHRSICSDAELLEALRAGGHNPVRLVG